MGGQQVDPGVQTQSETLTDASVMVSDSVQMEESASI